MRDRNYWFRSFPELHPGLDSSIEDVESRTGKVICHLEAGDFLPRLCLDQFVGFPGRSTAALRHVLESGPISQILHHRAHELKRSGPRRSVEIRLSHIMEDSVHSCGRAISTG